MKKVKARSGLRQIQECWRPFAAAREFARSLGLDGRTEWRAYAKGERTDLPLRPLDIPVSPDQAYRGRGWTSWGDWLGTGFVANSRKVFRPFEEARDLVRSLHFRNRDEWERYCRAGLPGKGRKPPDIPSAPSVAYKEAGWRGYDDWFGREILSHNLRQFRPFAQARKFVRSLDLKNQSEWGLYATGKLPAKGTKPPDIPTTPERVYKDRGWKNLGDWLGTGVTATRQRSYRPFEDARRFVQGLKLRNGAEWGRYCRGRMSRLGTPPGDIPHTPDAVYAARGWAGMGDWLGTGTVAPRLRQHRAFLEARDFVHRLQLKSQAQWFAYCRGGMPEKAPRPRDIPVHASRVYHGKGWINWGDWLGTGSTATWLRGYRPFAEARAFVRGLGLKNHREWNQYCTGHMPHLGRKPDDIPRDARVTYRNKGWKDTRDWLGIGKPVSRVPSHRPFAAAREFVRTLQLKSAKQWYAYCTGRMPHLGQKPADIPRCCDRVYRGAGWVDWYDWLGKS